MTGTAETPTVTPLPSLAPSPSHAAPWLLAALPWFALIGITLAVYLPGVLEPYGTLVEESITFEQNPWMDAFTVDNWWGLVTRPHYRDYTPVGWTYQFLIAGLFGRDTVVGLRIGSLLLQLALVLVGWRLLRALMPDRPWLALFVAAFYAIHPMSAEQAIWAPAQKWMLSVALAMAAMLLWWKARGGTPMPSAPGTAVGDTPGPPRMRVGLAALSCFVFLVALLSKGGTIVLPIVVLAAEWTIGRLPLRRAIIRTLPLFAISMAFGLFTTTLMNEAAAVKWVGGNPVTSFVSHLSALMRTIWHWGLPITWQGDAGQFRSTLTFYYRLDAALDLPSTLYALGCGLTALGMLAGAWLLAGRSRLATFAALWFLVSQLLVMGLIPHQWWPMADRYTCFGGWGLVLLGGTAVAGLLQRLSRARPDLRLPLKFGVAGGAVLLAAVVNTSLTQIQWQDAGQMAAHSVLNAPDSPSVLQRTLLKPAQDAFFQAFHALPLGRPLTSLEMPDVSLGAGSGPDRMSLYGLVRTVMLKPEAADGLYIDSYCTNALLLAILECRDMTPDAAAADRSAGPFGDMLVAHGDKFSMRPRVMIRLAIYHACRGRMDEARPWLQRYREDELVRWQEVIAHSDSARSTQPPPDNLWFIKGDCDYVRQMQILNEFALFADVALRDALLRHDDAGALRLMKAARMMCPDVPVFAALLHHAENGTLPGMKNSSRPAPDARAIGPDG